MLTRASPSQAEEPAEPVEPEPVVEPVAETMPEPVEEATEEVAPPPPPMADVLFEMPPLEEEAVDEGTIAKDALKAEVSQGLSSGASPDRAVVGEILLALEAQNPTRSPAT